MRNCLYAVIVLLVLTAVPGAFARTYLVAAGIADYPGAENDLQLTVADARAMVNLYKTNGDVEYRLLTDSEATESGIISAMNSLFGKAGKNDAVVFFFTGHGYPGGFAAYDGLVSYKKVRNAMKSGNAGKKIIFADACHSGKMRTPGKESNHSAASKKADVMLFLSSRDSEISYERKERGMKNGLFTAYLLRGLKGGADADKNRKVTAKEIFNYVSKGVKKTSRDKQHPVMWGNFPDNMTVMDWSR